MVDRRPRMRRSRRNATVLLFTCWIQRSDRSRMNSLFLTVGCLGFLFNRTCVVSLCSLPDPAACALPLSSPRSCPVCSLGLVISLQGQGIPLGKYSLQVRVGIIELMLLPPSSVPLVPVAFSHSYRSSWVVRRQSWFMFPARY
jgi:hypothetical protein